MRARWGESEGQMTPLPQQLEVCFALWSLKGALRVFSSSLFITIIIDNNNISHYHIYSDTFFFSNGKILWQNYHNGVWVLSSSLGRVSFLGQPPKNQVKIHQNDFIMNNEHYLSLCRPAPGTPPNSRYYLIFIE